MNVLFSIPFGDAVIDVTHIDADHPDGGIYCDYVINREVDGTKVDVTHDYAIEEISVCIETFVNGALREQLAAMGYGDTDA